MNHAITLSQNDAGIIISFLCRDESGAPVDLTQFSVDFMIFDGDTLLNEGRTTCTKPDAAMGIAEYHVAAEDTAAAGVFPAKLKLQNGSSEVRNIGGIPIQVLEM